MATPQDELKALKEKIAAQLKSNELSAAQVTNLTNAFNAISGTVNELEKYRTLSKDISILIDDIADNLDYITKNFKADVAYLTAGKSLLNDHKSAISKLANIAKETLDIRLGEQAIDEKRFKKLQEQTIKQIDILKLVRDQYVTEGKNTDAIQAQIDATELLRGGFSKVEEINKNLNKQLGAAPKLAAGIDKAFQKLGLPDLGFKEALDETKQLGQEAAAQGDEAFKKFSPIKTLTGKIWDNFKGIFTTANLLQASIGFMIDALITGDKATGDLAKDFNITYDAAAGVRNELIEIGNLSGNVALNARALQESMVAIGKALGSNAMLNQADLETFTELREMAGYTNEELVGIQKLTLATGGNLKNNTKQFLGTVSALNAQNKLTVNEKQLLKEVANTSAAIKLSVGGTTEGLAKAAFQAKQFGINLDQADRIAESLLDFESSITNELSAELITGKDLNLERARLLAINGDIAGASAEILQQVKGSAEFTKMNRIQQEALAKAVGMSREDLAASLIEREALAKIGQGETKAIDAYNKLKKEGLSDEQIAAKLGDDQLANQLKQQSIQERFNASVEKLKEIFVTIAEPLLSVLNVFAEIFKFIGPIVNGVASVVKYVMDWGKYLLPIIAAYKTFQVTSGIVLGIQAAFNKEKAFEYITSQKTLAAKIGERTYAIADLVIQKAKNSTLIKNIFLQNQSNIVGKKGLLQSIGDAAMSAIKGFTSLGPLGIALGLAAAGTVAALGYKYLKGDDVVSEGGYGNRTLLTPKGSIALNNQDTIIAGTNLGGKGKSNPNPTPPPQQDLSPLLEEMRAMRQETARSNNKPVVVDNNIDGTKFGTAIAMNKYKIQ